MLGLRPPEMLLIFIVVGFMAVWIFLLWRLVSKTGNPAPLSLLFLIPLVNIGMMFYFALSEWPIEREVKSLRQQSNRFPT